MLPSSISGINRLDESQKIEFYTQAIPPNILSRYRINPPYIDSHGNKLLHLNCPPGSSTVEITLFHKAGFPDPVMYLHLADTMNGQVHILLYIINNPEAPRFDVDVMPDGTPTKLGAIQRNLEAENAAMENGLAPGQIRRGLRLLGEVIQSFERFVTSLHHDLYFAEPLYYHNAILFERYGFSYEKGRKLMDEIQAGFSPEGTLLPKLDGSTPFRPPGAAGSIRMRSWAIHDGILGKPFTNVTMYKHVGKQANVSTCGTCNW
jgi:hypothetical protein